jgi:hypothetical protein
MKVLPGLLLTAAIVGAAATPPSAEQHCATPGNSKLWQDFVRASRSGSEPILPDFSYAGYHYSTRPIPDRRGPVFPVTEYGATPDDDRHDDEGIQKAIDAAAARGGGVVLFPKGRFLVSPTERPEQLITVSSGNIVLRGSGAGDGGTTLVMDRMKPGGVMFRVAPSDLTSNPLTTITADARRETFGVEVADPSVLRVGQRVVIRYQDPAYNAIYFGDLELSPAWKRVYANGMSFAEVHRVAAISGRRVRFEEPLHFTLVLNAAPFTLHNLAFIEEFGIEDIRFSGRWDEYPEPFVHHKDTYHDTAWSILSIKQVANSWIRRTEFRNVNQAINADTAVAFTFDRIRYTGKQGHTSIHARRGYGVLMKDNEDLAGHDHGPSMGYNAVATVILRHRMQVAQQIDSHGGVPYATLFDDVRGGIFEDNGGPHENYPNHAKYLVFWNFAHRAKKAHTYDFWRVATRENNTFALPIFAGFTHDRGVVFTDEARKVLRNESRGRRVSPASLFEAQLALRACVARHTP